MHRGPERRRRPQSGGDAPSWTLYVLVLAFACLSMAGSSRLAPRTNGLRQPFAANEAALHPHDDGFQIDDEPGSPALLARRWSLVRARAAAALTENPRVPAAGLVRALKSLDGSLDAGAVWLDRTTLLVSASLGEQGEIFVLSRGADGRLTTWSISQSAPAAGPLRAWSPDRANASCRARTRDEEAPVCGPLAGAIGRLRAARGGHPRFFVNATYTSAVGSTVGGQLSLWQWDGRAARPLLVIPYAYVIDRGPGLRVTGDRLRLREKGAFKSFFVTEPEPGRQLERTIRVGLDRVEDLGERPIAPDLDLADEFIDRTLRRLDTSPEATPAAVKMLASILADAHVVSDAAPDPASALGELWSWREARVGRLRALCIVTDGAGLVFTIAPGADGATIRGVTRLRGDHCTVH